MTSVVCCTSEAPVGIEPTNSRFAVCRLTTWPRRRTLNVTARDPRSQAEPFGRSPTRRLPRLHRQRRPTQILAIPHDAQPVSRVLHLVELSARVPERLVHHEHQLPIERAEQHPVPTVVPDERLELLPRSLQLSRLRARQRLHV